jgi:ElaB/YqjD/DUF883 family membrane-anchored ribosome-binding protein
MDVNNMTHQIEERAHELSARVRPQMREAREKLESMSETVTEYIKENPAKCLVGAIAIGYVVGKIARR